ncbi:DoxX family membrane protein [Novipirellula rosea]|uniref:DoxX family membrane protein n=1 Tax=Novipirellula rosea TaxID=1031540 RepID=A0ABP8MQ70_9BACT
MSEQQNNALSSIYLPLRLAYGLVPLLAGLDKFVGILADWEAYLPRFAADILPVTPAMFMMIVGVVEIVAGLAVLTVLTRLGAYIVMAWLVLISVAVVLSGHYDIAVRDLVMAIGAYVLGQVAGLRGEGWLPGTTVNEGVPTHATTT